MVVKTTLRNHSSRLGHDGAQARRLAVSQQRQDLGRGPGHQGSLGQEHPKGWDQDGGEEDGLSSRD